MFCVILRNDEPMTNIWINNVDDQRIDFYFAK